MSTIYLGKSSIHEVFRETYTQQAGRSDEFISKITQQLSKKYDIISVSESIPVYLNGQLCYTVTVTAKYK